MSKVQSKGVSKVVNIKISSIIINNDNHPREAVDKKVVAEYAQAMQDKAVFPPITVFQHGSKYYLADGRHRIEAKGVLGETEISAEVHQGSERDAILFSVKANTEHGLRRTNADKRKAIEILFRDKEWQKWSIEAISNQCNVSWMLVREVRNEVKGKFHLLDLEDTDTLKFKRKGKVHSQKAKRGTKPAGASKDSPTIAISEMIDLALKAKEHFSTEKDCKYIARVNEISTELQLLLKDSTNADFRMTKDIRQPLNVYLRARKDGVKPNPEFARKGLCNYSVGVAFVCGHQCCYCSTPSLIRTHGVFGDIKLTSFVRGYAVVDEKSAKRIKNSLPKGLTAEDTIMLSTIDDAWSPEARRYNLGHDVMEVLLENTPAKIRVLTKSAEVAKDFKLFAKFKDRVIVGLSTGIPSNREDVAEVVEPNASTIKERLEALKKAHDMGLKTYGMLCPCLPNVANSPEALNTMFDAVLKCGAGDIWLEPVNARGKALSNTSDALRRAGLKNEAQAVDNIRDKANWSPYTNALVMNAIDVAKSKGVLDKLHILLYTSRLTAEDLASLKEQHDGIVWLEKAKELEEEV